MSCPFCAETNAFPNSTFKPIGDMSEFEDYEEFFKCFRGHEMILNRKTGEIDLYEDGKRIRSKHRLRLDQIEKEEQTHDHTDG